MKFDNSKREEIKNHDNIKGRPRYISKPIKNRLININNKPSKIHIENADISQNSNISKAPFNKHNKDILNIYISKSIFKNINNNLEDNIMNDDKYEVDEIKV